MKKDYPKFYALYKNFNTGQLERIDVLNVIFTHIIKNNKLNKKDFILYDHTTFKSIPITTKSQLEELLKQLFIYYYWSKCEWEFLVVDWPNKDKVSDSRPEKIDIWYQIKPNLSIITDLVWNYIEPLL